MFCTLHIHSHTQSTLPANFVPSNKKGNIEFVDCESQEIKNRRDRVRAKLGLGAAQIARYQWKLTSDGMVENDDIYSHLVWIFQNFEGSSSVLKVLGPDFTCWVSVFWSGNGTGGGPLLETKTMEMLLFHQIDLGVAFYLED